VILRCRAKTGSELGPFHRGPYHSDDTIFSALRVGEAYRVYAMAIFKEEELASKLSPKPDWYPAQAGLIVLLCHEYAAPPTMRPEWYPIELFSIEDPRLPDDWEFSTSWEFGNAQSAQTNVQARWGYSELVHSDAHFEGLAEGDPVALEHFRAEHDRREDQDTIA